MSTAILHNTTVARITYNVLEETLNHALS